MPLAWITGAGGLIGNYVAKAAATLVPSWQIRPLTRGTLDLTDFAAVRRLFQSDTPQLIVHCAALSNTPACQQNPALARQLNVEVTAHLAELAASIPFLFFSTDLVFDGRQGHYDESARVNPLNVYADTKAAAEQIVLRNPRHIVLRTSLNGGVSPTGNRGFNEELRSAWRAGRPLKLFTDEFRCPIAAEVTARAVWALAVQDAPGLYHLAGAERLSRWEIGRLVAARWPQLQPVVEPASLRDYTGPARAPDTSLDCTKIQRLLPWPLPRFSEWLATHPHETF